MSFQDDKKTIIDILRFAERLLEELLKYITEDHNLFASAWSAEIKPDLQQLVTKIENIQSEQSPDWIAFRERGLRDEQLKLKRARLAAASKKGWRKKILDILNTILGSIPGADPIKEFKELTEEALGDDPSATVTTKFK